MTFRLVYESMVSLRFRDRVYPFADLADSV